MKTYILYHDPCTDGMGAKYAAWKKFGDTAIYLGVNYDKPLPGLEDGSTVYMVDFSVPKAQLHALKARMSKVFVIDHHKTAQEDLAGEPDTIFNMDKSGAVLAWEYFHPGTPVPTLLNVIQDRDLWRWAFPNTKHILNALSLHGNDVTTWDEISDVPESMVSDGKSVSKFQQGYVDFVTKPYNVTFISMNGAKGALVNTTSQGSEVGNKVCTDHNLDFCIYFSVIRSGVVNLGFRSNGFDVTPFAKALGGGGHKQASGARIDIHTLSRWLTDPKDILLDIK